MCCDECPKYDDCDSNDKLKDHCCSKCPAYSDCADRDKEDETSGKDPYSDEGSYSDTDEDDRYGKY